MRIEPQLALVEAAASGLLAAITDALDRGAQVDGVAQINRHGVVDPKTALYEAVRHLEVEAVRLLLARGARPEHTPLALTQASFWRTLSPAFAAAPGGPGSLVHVAAGAHVYHVDAEERSRRTQAIVAMLLAAGADPSPRDENGATPLHHAARVGKDAAVARALLATGVPVDAVDRAGWSALDHASDVGFATVLLDAGADPNGHAPDEGPLDRFFSGARLSCVEHQRRLTRQIAGGLVDIALLRLARGARATPGALFFAAGQGRPELVAALLAAGADPRDAEPNGHMSALVAAVRNGDARSVEALVAAGVPIEADAFWGTRSQAGAKIFAWLAARTDAATISDGLIRTAGVASAEEVAALIDAGADLERTIELGGVPGWTALHSAASQGNADAVRVLLARGASDRPGPDGKTALALARRSSAPDSRACSTMLVAGTRAKEPAPRVVDPHAVGERVSHAKFGVGTIVAVEGPAGEQRKLTIEFGGTRRVLLAKFVAPA
ncbi:ankyrin repeat domain-containing protein [Nannocystis radixulma]|uniref:Ankyrin repeat domain-containing protein n=1 Tax=Nannocystis radixulma TaxID=2995305 RepID=A0ABT5AZ02_9BACT|nr:ankyrin repeat domain-containing protein [Nannocystis radixulma]MDC0666509.1 ankyrin repeat domain-containing protein [Nannocystis radixulma]